MLSNVIYYTTTLFTVQNFIKVSITSAPKSSPFNMKSFIFSLLVFLCYSNLVVGAQKSHKKTKRSKVTKKSTKVAKEGVVVTSVDVTSYDDITNDDDDDDNIDDDDNMHVSALQYGYDITSVDVTSVYVASVYYNTPLEPMCDHFCSVVQCTTSPLCTGCSFCTTPPPRCDSWCSRHTSLSLYNCRDCDYGLPQVCPSHCSRMSCGSDFSCGLCPSCVYPQAAMCDSYCGAALTVPQCSGCPVHQKFRSLRAYGYQGFCDSYCSESIRNFGIDTPESIYRPCGGCTSVPPY